MGQPYIFSPQVHAFRRSSVQSECFFELGESLDSGIDARRAGPLTLSLRQPTGNASVPYWTHHQGLGTAAQAFVDDQLSGLGLRGIWGAENVPEPEGNTPEERAEVWFDRV